ncbi:O-antigen ligase family protein [Acidobacteriota bacterium]
MTNKLKNLLPISLTIFLLFSMVSISISQISLVLAFLIWTWLIVRKENKFLFPAFFWGMIAYSVLSLVSSIFSVNPGISLGASKQLLYLLIVPITYASFQKTIEIKRASSALMASAYIAILFSLIYYLAKAAPGERIAGFMGHYMTQAGVLLLFSAVALSMFIFTRDKLRYLWGIAFCLSQVVLILTSTRSAWIGMIIAAIVVLFFYKPKTLIVVPVVVVLIMLISPREVKQRALSIFSTRSYSNAQRIEYMQVGLQIIREYPLVGTGPDTVDMVFQHPKYKLSQDAKRNVHLHNNIIQIGAERGIPTLIVWLATMVWIFISLCKLIPNKDPALFPLTVAALAAFLAHFTAGLFEYNFADAEVAVLFLYIITIPFAQARILAGSDRPGNEQ